MTSTGIRLRTAPTDVVLPAGLLLVSTAVLCAAVFAAQGVTPAAGLVAASAVLAVAYRQLLRWDVLVAFAVVVVLVIPIKRYEFAVSLPFDLEPYRIVLAGVLVLWIAALLVQPDVSLRGSFLDAPLGLLAISVIASVVLNMHSIIDVDIRTAFLGTDFRGIVNTDGVPAPPLDISTNVLKELLFLASFYLAFYLVVGVVRSPKAVHVLLKTMVSVTAVVALSAIVERRTQYNVFDHLQGWIPLIQFEGAIDETAIQRGGQNRVYGSAQHPIALAAVLVMMLPLAAYLARYTRRRLWYGAAVLLALGALATVSRTSVTMLAALAVVFFIVRREALRKVGILLLPALIVVHLALPGTIGSLRQSFFPSEGLIADQTEYGGRVSGRRLAPQFDAIRTSPMFGQGYGTRITAGTPKTALILDDQWLGTAVEIGLVGMFAWLWIFGRFIRRTGKEAKRDPSDRGWLLAALASSVTALGVGMLTFDAFSFIQGTFVLFVLLAIGCSVLAWPRGEPGAEDAAPATAS